jgi:hypothetical protein
MLKPCFLHPAEAFEAVGVYDPAAGDEERAADGAGRGSLAPKPPTTESAGKHRDDRSQLKHAGDTTVVNPKTLAFSARLGFSIATGLDEASTRSSA